MPARLRLGDSAVIVRKENAHWATIMEERVFNHMAHSLGFFLSWFFGYL